MAGFTGMVQVALLDAAGNVLYVTKGRSYGVDGTYVVGKSSDRRSSWVDQVPPGVLSQVGAFSILHTTNPKTRWDEWNKAAGEIKQLMNNF